MFALLVYVAMLVGLVVLFSICVVVCVVLYLLNFAEVDAVVEVAELAELC